LIPEWVGCVAILASSCVLVRSDGASPHLRAARNHPASPRPARPGNIHFGPTVAQIRAMEAAGIKETVIEPPADFQREVFRDFAELVMPAFH
jgi:hypothetical protein